MKPQATTQTEIEFEIFLGTGLSLVGFLLLVLLFV